MTDYAVIVCAKAKSERFPGKNLHPVCGKPLIQHTFDFIQENLDVRLKNIWVVTDSDDILNMAEKYGFGRMREPEQFVNNSHNMPLMRWIDEILKAQNYIMLPATSPVRDASLMCHIADFLRYSHNDGHTVTKDVRGVYRANGALFMWHHSQLENNDIISDNPRLYIDPYNLDIDTIEDLKKVENHFLNFKEKVKE